MEHGNAKTRIENSAMTAVANGANPASFTALHSEFRVNCSLQGDPGRPRVERYIAGIFQAAYDARVMEYMPMLCSLERHDTLVAALGLRKAGGKQLFCEQYLDEPVESVVTGAFGTRTPRQSIWELGNLVASSPGQAVRLYLLVAAALGEIGVRYLTFAAIRPVRNSIQRCGFSTRVICDAHPARLGERAQEWGSYYENDPKVVLADIRQALRHGYSDPAIGKLWREERATIRSLADDLAGTNV